MDAIEIGVMGGIALVLGEILKVSVWPGADNPGRRYIPLALVPSMAVIGAMLAAVNAQLVVSGALQGFFAGALASGIYEFGKAGLSLGRHE